MITRLPELLPQFEHVCFYRFVTKHQRMVCLACMTHTGPARARHKSPLIELIIAS